MEKIVITIELEVLGASDPEDQASEASAVIEHTIDCEVPNPTLSIKSSVVKSEDPDDEFTPDVSGEPLCGY